MIEIKWLGIMLILLTIPLIFYVIRVFAFGLEARVTETASLIIAAIGTIISLIVAFTNTIHTYEIVKEPIIVVSTTITLIIVIGIIIIRVIKRSKPRRVIFISYAMADEYVVKKISHIIQQQSLRSKYCYTIEQDITDISLGENLQKTIVQKILKSYAVIVFISENYINSDFCCKEFELIVSQHTRVIPLLIGTKDIVVTLPDSIKAYVDNTEYALVNQEDIYDVARLDSLAQEIFKSLEKNTNAEDDSSFPKSKNVLSPDGKLVAIIKKNGSIEIWDIMQNVKLSVFVVGFGHVVDVKFTPDGRLLSALYSDGVIRIWDLLTGDVVREFET